MSQLNLNRAPSGYDELQLIGRGAYGYVYKGVEIATGRRIAMKKMNLSIEREGIPTTTLREISILKELNHQNIIKLFDVVVVEKKIYLIFELLESDLRRSLDYNIYNSDQVKLIMRQLLEGIDHCHSRRFMHRDLKPENILIDSNNCIKIADFGLARAYQIPGKVYTNEVQTLWYRSPEILLEKDHYSVAIDMWSAGCIFAELIRCRPLFQGTTPISQINEIFKVLGTPTENDWPGVTQLKGFKAHFEHFSARPLAQVFVGVENNAIDLISRMLTLNPERRISARAALSHPYFLQS